MLNLGLGEMSMERHAGSVKKGKSRCGASGHLAGLSGLEYEVGSTQMHGPNLMERFISLGTSDSIMFGI